MSAEINAPISAEINALPERMRQYVHYLETNADPGPGTSGDCSSRRGRSRGSRRNFGYYGRF